MYRNILGHLGHRWIDEYALNELKKLPDCYFVDVALFNGHYVPISKITGTETGIYGINIYFKGKDDDKSPYYFSVCSPVNAFMLDDFRRDCENRGRTPQLAPYCDVTFSERELREMRKKLKRRMLEVFSAVSEPEEEYNDEDFICHRNRYERLGLRKMLEYVRQADAMGINIVISFHIQDADADQMQRTLNDLEMIDATVENEPLIPET